MQMIRSDNGTEYTSKKFNKFCEDTGVEHQLTAPYSPQQNGTAERKNRTIMEMARCLLHDKDLPKKFWAEAVNTAVFLLNRLPTKALQQKTPFEAWYGYKPELFNLKIFGCLCFSYIPHIKRDELDKKAEPGIFVGYSLISKAYRIYLSHKNKVIVSRDVKFLEYVSAAAAVNQTVWIRKIMADLHIEQEDSTKIFVDNQAAISIANNPVFHGKTKHFKIKLFFLREVQREGQVKLVYCKSEDQVADILTKALPKSRFEFLRQKLGVCNSKVKEEC